jgi:hypothetical protein
LEHTPFITDWTMKGAERSKKLKGKEVAVAPSRAQGGETTKIEWWKKIGPLGKAVVTVSTVLGALVAIIGYLTDWFAASQIECLCPNANLLAKQHQELKIKVTNANKRHAASIRVKRLGLLDERGAALGQQELSLQHPAFFSLDKGQSEELAVGLERRGVGSYRLVLDLAVGAGVLLSAKPVRLEVAFKVRPAYEFSRPYGIIVSAPGVGCKFLVDLTVGMDVEWVRCEAVMRDMPGVRMIGVSEAAGDPALIESGGGISIFKWRTKNLKSWQPSGIQVGLSANKPTAAAEWSNLCNQISFKVSDN